MKKGIPRRNWGRAVWLIPIVLVIEAGIRTIDVSRVGEDYVNSQSRA